MSFAIGGVKVTEGAIGGVKFTKGAIGGVKFGAAAAPVDRAGTLNVDARRASRGANIDYSITDPDGISAVTSVVMLADDGTRSDVTSEIARVDANTLSGTSRRLNNKWRVASITISYADARSGDSHTLRRGWSL